MDLGALPSRTMPERMEACRRHVAALGADAYWLVHGPDVRYLSGFTGDDSTLLVTRERSVLITDSRYEEQAHAEARVDEVEVRQKPMAKTVGVLCGALGVRALGVTAHRVTHADWVALAAETPAAELRACQSGPATRLRTRKSAEEVAAIAEALHIAEGAFQRFAAEVEPGRSEKWLAGRLEWEMKAAGADGPAFPTICAAGPRGSMPHAVCTDAELGGNAPLLVDWGACRGGYNSDLTRVLGTGTMPQQVEQLAQVVLEAQEAAFREARPGVPCGQVDLAARAVIARAGYGPFFGHSLGHGVGLEVHEAPRVGPGEREILLPGMVFTIEPGIYLPGVAGVRIEDLVVATDAGIQVLSSIERAPTVVG